MVTLGWPMADNHRTFWLDDVTHGAHGVTEILGIIFLITTTEQRNQLAFEIYLFQRWEKVVPVTLCFTVIPSRNTDQQNIEFFQILFAAFSNVVYLGNIFTQLFLDHFSDVFGVTSIGSKEDSYYGHKIRNLLFSMKSLIPVIFQDSDALATLSCNLNDFGHTSQAIVPQIIANSPHGEHASAHLYGLENKFIGH